MSEREALAKECKGRAGLHAAFGDEPEAEFFRNLAAALTAAPLPSAEQGEQEVEYRRLRNALINAAENEAFTSAVDEASAALDRFVLSLIRGEEGKPT